MSLSSSSPGCVKNVLLQYSPKKLSALYHLQSDNIVCKKVYVIIIDFQSKQIIWNWNAGDLNVIFPFLLEK